MRISDWSSDVCSSDLELLPDRARSDDQQLLGHFRRHHRVTIGPNALAVRLGERQIARPRAGGDDDVLCLKLGGLAVPGDREPALGDDLPHALDAGALVLLYQSFDARTELHRDLARGERGIASCWESVCREVQNWGGVE